MRKSLWREPRWNADRRAPLRAFLDPWGRFGGGMPRPLARRMDQRACRRSASLSFCGLHSLIAKEPGATPATSPASRFASAFVAKTGPANSEIVIRPFAVRQSKARAPRRAARMRECVMKDTEFRALSAMVKAGLKRVGRNSDSVLRPWIAISGACCAIAPYGKINGAAERTRTSTGCPASTSS